MTTKYDSDIRFRNVSGDKILRGAPVMLVSAVGQHGLLTGTLMDASDTANFEKYLGLATADVIDGAEGHIRAFGDIRAADTSAWEDGDVLYCDPETPGAMTATKPGTGLVFPVAFVSRAHAEQGVLQVKSAPSQSNVVTYSESVTGGVKFSVPIPPDRFVGAENDQPVAIASALTNVGKLACRFGAGQWSVVVGSPTLTQGYTGWDDATGDKTGIVSRTGMPDMLRVVPAGGGTEQISLGTFSTNMLTKDLNGKFGLWVYIDKPDSSNIDIGVELSTGSAGVNCLYVNFTAPQIRHGWNFLKFVMRTPAAYVDGSGVSEDHPYGIQAVNFGTGSNADIKNSNVAALRIQWRNATGCTLYFDSMWTGFASKPQVVFGCDGGVYFESIARPIFDSYGWVGYLAYPIAVQAKQVITDIGPLTSYSNGLLQRTHKAGWDIINHTANHIAVGALTSAAEVVYELQAARDWQVSLGCTRGMEFYASPMTNTSRLAEEVIAKMGFVLQRHASHHNITPTQWGIDNPRCVGSIDMGSAIAPAYSTTTAGAAANVGGQQKFSKLKGTLDAAVAYGDTIFPFWHGVTTVGDSGSGEDLTGDNLLLTASAFTKFMEYVRGLETAGTLTVCRGMSGFWYGE